MSITTLPKQMPKRYPELVKLLAPRKIHDEIDLENVTEIMDRLAVLDTHTKDQADYLDTLATLVAVYENEHHQIDTSELTPLEMLKFLLNENDMSGSDLGRLLGQRQLGTAILRGERQLSKTHIKKLADYFRINPKLFLG